MAAPTKILITTDAVGGVWQYAADLAQALSPLGYEATLALLGPAPSAAQRAELGEVPFVETGLPLDWLCGGPEPVRAAGHALARLAGEGGYDLVQLNMPSLAAAGRFAMPVVAVAHGCLATWWDGVRGTPLPPEFAWQSELLHAAFARADRVVAPTRAFAETVRRRYDLAARPAAIHNGRRPTHTVPVVAGAPVLTVGRLWDDAKDVALLDRVAGRLAVPFEAVGPLHGPQGQTTALSHLVPLGRLGSEAVAARLAAAPLFVSAARFEPFGLAVLEAAQAGCPLILSDIPTFREVWDGAARFVPVGDEAEFVAAIDAVLGNPALRASLGAAARARAADFTPAATAHGMTAVYAELLSARAITRRAAA